MRRQLRILLDGARTACALSLIAAGAAHAQGIPEDPLVPVIGGSPG